MECKQAHKQRLFFNQFIAALSRLRQGVKQFGSWGRKFTVSQSDPRRNQKLLAVFQSDPCRNQKSLAVFQSDPCRNQKSLTVFQSDPCRNQKSLTVFQSDTRRNQKSLAVFQSDPIKSWKGGAFSAQVSMDYCSPPTSRGVVPALHGPSP